MCAMGVEHSGRSVDVSAMVRVVSRSQSPLPADVVRMRRLVADLCRLMAPGAVSPQVRALHVPAEVVSEPITHSKSDPDDVRGSAQPGVSPRMRQTLEHLLAGDQEKQVARRLGVSQNTVHVYVKALYRHFDVNSRAELMSKFVRAPATR